MIEELILAHASRERMHAAIAERCIRPDVECFYFGCIGGPGHRFHARRRPTSACEELERAVAAALGRGGIDARLCWNSPKGDRDRYDRRDETEGLAFRTCCGGYTAVAFWDRSVDRRGACNSVFIVRGDLTFKQVMRVARHCWPRVLGRFSFDVVEVDADGRRVRE